MTKGAIRYKDVWAAPNSQLYAVLTDPKLSPAGREMKAKQVYKEAHKHFYWPAELEYLLNWRIGDSLQQTP